MSMSQFSQLSRNEIFQLLIRLGVVSAVSYFSVKWIMEQMDPTNAKKKKSRREAELIIKRLDTTMPIDLKALNDYELVIASHLVVPEDITVSWDDIAGLEAIIEELRETVVLPVRHHALFKESKLWEAPKGVLLHGPPGCGKTLIAKATAKEAGMHFINLDVAMLTDKWYGESQKLASAVFSLAKKIQPCIVFMDEIDSFLRSRNTQDHEATAMMKTQFMMLWDGLSTEQGSTVIVMGATNRPQDLDNAILRRMPAKFLVGLPNEEQRLKILALILKSENIRNEVDLPHLASLTKGFSGSDLRELCRYASVYCVREYINKIDNNTMGRTAQGQPPPMGMTDLMKAFGKMKESKIHAGA